MVMFLPFLLAVATALTTVVGLRKISYLLWIILLATTCAWFQYHATSALALSF